MSLALDQSDSSGGVQGNAFSRLIRITRLFGVVVLSVVPFLLLQCQVWEMRCAVPRS